MTKGNNFRDRSPELKCDEVDSNVATAAEQTNLFGTPNFPDSSIGPMFIFLLGTLLFESFPRDDQKSGMDIFKRLVCSGLRVHMDLYSV